MSDLSHYLTKFDKQASYEIIINGTITADYFVGIEDLSASQDQLEDGKAVTILTGTFTNQDVLAGLLNLIYELHLSIISVRKLFL